MHEEQWTEGKQSIRQNLEEIAPRLHVEAEEYRDERAPGDAGFPSQAVEATDEMDGQTEIQECQYGQSNPAELQQHFHMLRRGDAGLFDTLGAEATQIVG